MKPQAARIAILATALFLIPSAGWIASFYLASSWNSALRVASLTIGTLGLALIGFVFLGRAVAGHNRHRLCLIFSPLLRVVFFVLGISVVGQAALLVYIVYVLETATGRFAPNGSLLLVGIAAVFASGTLLRSSLGVFRPRPLSVSALRLSRTNAEGMFRLADEVAQKVKSSAPDNIIVGLEPQFFVTIAPVKLNAERDLVMTGTTMYVSLALLHVLSRDELAAVIGHELGHFRNQDLEYSLKFQPIYARLSSALNDLDVVESAIELVALLPAAAVLTICLSQFARAERAIGREREISADRAGVEAAGARELAAALLKVVLYSIAWQQVTTREGARSSKSKEGAVEKFGEAFAEASNSLFSAIEWPQVWPKLLGSSISHPIDSHPPLRVRFEAMEIRIGDEDASIIRPADAPTASLIQDAADYDRRLTEDEKASLRFRAFARAGGLEQGRAW